MCKYIHAYTDICNNNVKSLLSKKKKLKDEISLQLDIEKRDNLCLYSTAGGYCQINSCQLMKVKDSSNI